MAALTPVFPSQQEQEVTARSNSNSGDHEPRGAADDVVGASGDTVATAGNSDARPDNTPAVPTSSSSTARASALNEAAQVASSGEETAGGGATHTGDVSIALEEIDRREFDSWDDLTAYLTVYSERTLQVYVIKSATPVASRNARLDRQPYAQRNQYIPEDFRAYARTYTCTHAGVARYRSTGLRPGTSTRCLGCPARLNACVQRTRTHKWKVRITKHHAVHNHAIGTDVFAQYPARRRVTDPRVLHTVDVLRRVGVEPKKILAYIHADSSARPTLEDVYNLLAKQRRAEDDADDSGDGGSGEATSTAREAERASDN